MNVYEIVTGEIIKKLESGIIPWIKPWNSANPKNLVSKKEYRGINSLLLSFSPYASPYWLTYKQSGDLGGNVKKGEHGSLVVFWMKTEKKTDDETRKGFILRYYKVFNFEQCEGIQSPSEETVKGAESLVEADSIIESWKDKPVLKHEGNQACYIPSQDAILLPTMEKFKGTEEYYSTLFHEAIHATGHEKRLNRLEKARFGSEKYSKEELIAEMGSAFLCRKAGIQATIANSAAYIQSWLKALKNDSSLVISAASKAQVASEYILNSNPEEVEA